MDDIKVILNEWMQTGYYIDIQGKEQYIIINYKDKRADTIGKFNNLVNQIKQDKAEQIKAWQNKFKANKKA